MKYVTLTEARNQLLRLAGEIERQPDTVIEVRKRGKRVMTLMSAELYDSLVETLEILADESVTPKLKQALREIERGRGIPWKTAKSKLGLEE